MPAAPAKIHSTSTRGISRELGLNQPRSEVLSWLSKGKTNRDISRSAG